MKKREKEKIRDLSYKICSENTRRRLEWNHFLIILMKNPLFALAIISTLLITACEVPAHPDDVQTEPETTTNSEMPTETTPEMDEAENNTEEASESPEESEEMAGEDFEVIAYTAESREAVHGKKPYVINFKASWCPTCKALEKTVNENLDKLPKGAVMLNADYDEEVELKKEYKVTNQTTLIFFDAEGNQVASQYNPSIEKMSELLTR